MRRPVERLWALTRESDGPLRRAGDLEEAVNALPAHEQQVLMAIIEDAVSTIQRLRRESKNAQRGILR